MMGLAKSAALPVWRTSLTSLDGKLMQIRRWLKVCERELPVRCPIDRSFVPTRLIKLDLTASASVAKLVQVAKPCVSGPT